jgi:phosphate/phosphite/phosphonate ABC transporter binding protein
VIAGKYHLGRVLGEGGMGSVYEAEHRELGAKVAVKLLSETSLTQEKSLARFRREAKAMAAIRHENVVSVMDAGTDSDGLPFLVMELLDGESLASKLRRERVLSPSLACWISCEILAGLGAAHAAGIVHRDLKPGNVFICKQTDGSYRVKLLDFGISKVWDSSGTLNVTADGALVGTPNFMAPEQVYANKPVDGRVDIYAAGVILYRMVTGTLPYVGKTTEELYRNIIDARAYRPRQVRPEVPEELESIIMRAMHPDRDQRYQTAGEFRDALKRVMPESAAAMAGHAQRPSRASKSSGGERSERDAAYAPTPYKERTGPASRPVATQPARRSWAWAAILLIILGAAFAAVLAYKITRDRQGQASAPIEEPSVVPLGESIRFGITRHKNPEEIKAEMQPLLDYLEAELQRPLELVIVDNYEDLSDSLLQGKVDMAALSAYSYIRAKRKVESLRLLATPTTAAGPTYGGYVLARANTGISKLTDLRGKTFCYVSKNSTSGYLYPRALMRQHEINPDEDFSATRFTSDHTASMRTLADGTCDGAAVYDSAWFEASKHGLDPSAFTVVGTTERVPWDAYCSTDRLDSDVTEKIENALRVLSPGSARAKEVFKPGQSPFEGFIAGDDSLYDPVRSLEQYLDQDE